MRYIVFNEKKIFQIERNNDSSGDKGRKNGDDARDSGGDAKKVVDDSQGGGGGTHDALKLNGDSPHSSDESVEGGNEVGPRKDDEAMKHRVMHGNKDDGGTNNTFKGAPEAASGRSSGTVADNNASGQETRRMDDCASPPVLG